MVGQIVGKPSAAPFHQQNLCGDRSNTDGLAYYILHNVKSLYIQIIYQLILYWSIYYIVGLVKNCRPSRSTDKNSHGAEIGAILTDLYIEYSNVKSLYIQIIYQLIVYWLIYYIVGLVKKLSAVPFHRQDSPGNRVNTDRYAY